ncbi:MAG: transcription factor S [Candidatus Aenigmarchaeota archaeon]|nr:transcription factor S [Candidatus Aenigmarchaeota archaeon]
MEFCPKCGGLMIVKGKKLVCTKCGYTKRIGKNTKTVITEKINVKDEIIVMKEDEEEKTYPSIKKICPKCGHDEAIWWMQQTRSADEPPTMFFRCKKCGYTWREY